VGAGSSRLLAQRFHGIHRMQPNPLAFRPHQCHASAFIAPGAVVLGDVTLSEQASVWFNAVLRGDTAPITVGRQTNVQDGCILHADPGFPCTLGDRVTLGHGAIVHGATIGDDVMIGMRAVVMNGAKIGRGSLVAVGAIVLEGVEVPPGSVVMGVPATVKRQASEQDVARIRHAADHYVAAAQAYAAGQPHWATLSGPSEAVLQPGNADGPAEANRNIVPR
jgi:carbonic anhydrase/acetyltransferase-like protein (isoleucine patch superfamily)